LVLFGSGGFSTFSNVINLACGDAPTCGNRDTGVTYSGGVAYWFTPYLAVEGSYLKPAKATADGGGTGYRFNSELDTHVLNLGGNVGVPIGPVRLYGKIAATYHRASFETTETIDDSTVTIDDVPQTIEGGTQSYDLRTGGWGWMFGGGLEAWATPTFAFYAEGGRAVIKGDHLDEGEGAMDDRLLYVLVGARFRIGR
jgi:hypothetical protein